MSPSVRTSHSPLAVTLLGIAAILSLGCDDPTGPTTVVTTLRVVTVTAGTNLDPDGYSVNVVNVDAPYQYDPRSIAINGTVTFADINEGRHTVTLDGVDNNCTLVGDNSRSVSVTFGATVQVTFTIQCSATSSLQVTVATRGIDLDPNGYGVHVRGANFGEFQDLTINESLTFPSLPSGDHVVTLLGVAANCGVANSNRRTVALVAGTTTIVAFDVTCFASSSSRS